MSITVGENMIVEGLAESLGTALYGKDRVGYYIVQDCMKKTGKYIVETTFVPFALIIRESGFFD